MTNPTADQMISWLENHWLGWKESWYSDFIPFQEKHGYPRHIIVEWCGGLLCEDIWENGGAYGVSLPPNNATNSWYTPTGVAQFIAAKRWTHIPRRGSWIFFDWGGSGLGWSGGVVDHVGIVTGPLLRDGDGNVVHDEEGQEMIDTSGGYVDTIEGNVNEACGRFRRWFSSKTIRGFGLPVYDPALSARVTTEPEPDPVRPFVPFMESESDDMIVIHLLDSDEVLGNIPRTFGVLGGTLFPILAPEIRGETISHVEMSLSIFQSFYGRYVWANRLALDLTPLK